MAAAKHILFGFHPVVEALRAGRRRIYEINLADNKKSARRQQVALLAEQSSVPVRWVSHQVLTDMVRSIHHQGIGAKVAGYPLSSLDEILAAARKADRPPFVLALDQILDPQNLGAIVRTAHCAGMDGVMIPKHRSAPLSPLVSKASAGALEHIRLISVTNLTTTLKKIKSDGFWIVGADQQGAQSLYNLDLTGPLTLVIGGEEKGLRPLVKKQCDFFATIPQSGPIGSLNASVAAAVIIYEAFRQRRIDK